MHPASRPRAQKCYHDLTVAASGATGPDTASDRRQAGKAVGAMPRSVCPRFGVQCGCVGARTGGFGSVSHQNGFGSGFCSGQIIVSVSPSYSSPFFIT
jgi:hypothetical protein